MKNILFATTALVATAGSAAYADVTFSGYGRFGAVYSENNDLGGTTDETFLHYRLRLQIDMVTEADNGLTFGGRYRIQDTGNGPFGSAGGNVNMAKLWVSAGGLTVQVGNVDYALDNMPGGYVVGGKGVAEETFSTGFGTGFVGIPAYNSAGGANMGAAVLYSVGDLSAHVAHDAQADLTDAHIAYTYMGWTGAVGYLDSNSDFDTEWAATVSGALAGADLTLAYYDNGDRGNAYSIGGSFEVSSATTVGAFYSYVENEPANDEIDGYGVFADHDLGGGALLRGLVGQRDDNLYADMGVKFNF